MLYKEGTEKGLDFMLSTALRLGIEPRVTGPEGKGTVQRVLSIHCVGHSQLAAHYKY